MLEFPTNGITQEDAYAKGRRHVSAEIGEIIERLQDAVAAYDDLGGTLPHWWSVAFQDLSRAEKRRK